MFKISFLQRIQYIDIKEWLVQIVRQEKIVAGNPEGAKIMGRAEQTAVIN